MPTDLTKHIRAALDCEEPAKRLHVILPKDHEYRLGLADALNFEKHYLDVKRSLVPVRLQNQYKMYLARLNRAEYGSKMKQSTPMYTLQHLKNLSRASK